MSELYLHAKFGNMDAINKVIDSNKHRILMGSTKYLSKDGVSYFLKFAKNIDREVVSIQSLRLRYLNNKELHEKITHKSD